MTRIIIIPTHVIAVRAEFAACVARDQTLSLRRRPRRSRPSSGDVTYTNFSHRECITFTRPSAFLVILRAAGRYAGYNTRSLMDAILLSNTGYLISMIKRHSIEQVQRPAVSRARTTLTTCHRIYQSLDSAKHISSLVSLYLSLAFLPSFEGFAGQNRSYRPLYLCNRAQPS